MGMLDIRMRGERLGNIGAVQRVQTDNGAAAAFAARAGLGRVVSGLGGDMTRIAIEADRRIQDNAADEYVAKFEKAMLDYQRGSVAPDGTRTSGAMEAPIEDTAKWMKENGEFRDRLGFRLKKELKMSDRAMRLARERLRHFNMGLDGQWAERAMRTDKAREIGNAQGRMELETFNMSQPGATEETTRAWIDAVEGYLDKAQVFGAEERAAVKRQQALRILDAGIGNLVSQVREDESGENSQGGKRFDEWIKALKDGEVDQLLPFWSYVDDGNGGKTNPLADALGEADLTAFKKSAVERMAAAKDSWERDMAAKRREEHDAVVRRSVEGELAIRDIPEEKWAESYERLGRDENLTRLDPARAMRYLDTARDIRNAEKRAKDAEAEKAAKLATEAEKKRLADGESALKLTEARIMYLRADGSEESLRKADEMECDLFRAAQRRFAEGDITHDAYVSYMKRRKETLSMDEMRAMQKFDNAFGLDFGIAAGGGVGAAERKAWLDEDGEFEVTIGDETEEYDREEFFKFRDRFMRSMKRMKEDISRAGAVDDAIVQIKREMASGKDFKEIETIAEQIAAEAEITSRSEVMRRADENK